MHESSIIEEIVCLGPVRLQKSFVLDKKILVLEIFSKELKKLYLVCDVSPRNPSLHIQSEKPAGEKSIHPLALLLHKYADDSWIEFDKVSPDDDALKVRGLSNQELCLLFEFFPTLSVGLFIQNKLMAYLGEKSHLRPRPSIVFKSCTKKTLVKNNERASHYQATAQKILVEASEAIHDQGLKNQIRKKQILLKNLQQDLKKCQTNISLADNAELLKLNLGTVKKGASEIEVIDYKTNPPSSKIIALDPRMSTKDFLEKLFQKIKKAKRGLNIIEQRIAATKDEIEKLNAQQSQLFSLEHCPQKNQQNLPKTKESNIERLPYRSYVSLDNIKIFVGRSDKDSDDLTMHYAHGNDWWFHTADYPGAHVVVKYNQESIPEKTFLQACMLAQYFSKAKHHPRAAINYTRAKFVKKPKGFVRGRVLISQEKTVEIAMDEKMLRQLIDQDR